jgi:hypothetical protein
MEMLAHTETMEKSSIQDEYNLLCLSIRKLGVRTRQLKELLVRSKLLTVESSASSVESIRLEYLSSRLMRLRQLNVLTANSERRGEARESYALWCTNQRNLAIRKAKLDLEEVRKKAAARKGAETAAAPSDASPRPKRRGLGDLFGSDDVTVVAGARHVAFSSVDSYSTDADKRKSSFFGVVDGGTVLPDPLSGDGRGLSDVMAGRVQEVVQRHKAYLNGLRRVDGILVKEEIVAPPPLPPPLPPPPSSSQSPVPAEGAAGAASPLLKTGRMGVSFCESTVDRPQGGGTNSAASGSGSGSPG